MIEVELKCALSLEKSAQVLPQLHDWRALGTIDNEDLYYDTPDLALLKQAVFVRVRNGAKLEFKFNEAAEVEHIQSTERVFPLSAFPAIAIQANKLFARFLPGWQPGENFEEMRSMNRLEVLAPIRNRRERFVSDDMQLSLDHVEGLGDFLELEIAYEDEADTAPAQARLYACINRFSLQPIKVGYVEMWLRLHNPSAYASGKYRF